MVRLSGMLVLPCNGARRARLRHAHRNPNAASRRSIDALTPALARLGNPSIAVDVALDMSTTRQSPGGFSVVVAGGPRLADAVHGAAAAAVGTTVAAAGGGVLVVVGVVIAAIVVPAFVRYRVTEGDKV